MNWGNGLFVTFIVFIASMSYLVYRSVHTEFQLVEKEYYKSEITYQQVIDGSNAANRLSAPIHIIQLNEEIKLQLPNEMKGAELVGSIWFYCSYEAHNDKKFPLQVNAEGYQIIPKKSIAPGNYLAKINWQLNGNNYYTEQPVKIN